MEIRHCGRTGRHLEHDWVLRRELVHCPGTPNPVIPLVMDGSYQEGDRIRLDAVVLRVWESVLDIQLSGTPADEKFCVPRTVMGELIERKKTPGQRAYEAAPDRMGRRPWGELDETDQQEWHAIAAAARGDG
jgi:hypothetical protein